MHIAPSRERYDPSLDLTQAGTYVAVCTDVHQGIPWPEYPGKTRIAIQFTVSDARHPRQNGKKTAIVCGESIYCPRGGGTPSRLYTYAVQMGVESPERGFDPDQFLDQWYMVVCEEHQGKAMVRQAIPIPDPRQVTAPPHAARSTAAESVRADDDAVPF